MTRYVSKFKPFMTFMGRVRRFGFLFVTTLFRTYLTRFRQAVIFRFLRSIVFSFLRRFGLLETKLEFFGLDNDSVTANFLARYIARKIEMRFRIKELYSPIKRELRILVKTSAIVLGYKLQFVGRLTRRGKVRTTWAFGGNMPFSTVSAQIEHSYYLGILRNGVCCIRVWLYRHKSFGNYNYGYSYRLNY